MTRVSCAYATTILATTTRVSRSDSCLDGCHKFTEKRHHCGMATTTATTTTTTLTMAQRHLVLASDTSYDAPLSVSDRVFRHCATLRNLLDSVGEMGGDGDGDGEPYVDMSHISSDTFRFVEALVASTTPVEMRAAMPADFGSLVRYAASCNFLDLDLDPYMRTIFEEIKARLAGKSASEMRVMFGVAPDDHGFTNTECEQIRTEQMWFGVSAEGIAAAAAAAADEDDDEDEDVMSDL